MKVLTIW